MASNPPVLSPQDARSKHIINVVRDRKPPDVSYDALAKEMSSSEPNFKAWQDASKEYSNAVLFKHTSTAGDIEQRKILLHKARIARIRYLAPLDMATAAARGGSQGLLTSEEWDMLACAENAQGTDKDSTKLRPVSELTGEARVEAVNAFKKKEYGKYENLVSKDQLDRSQREVEKSRLSAKGLYRRTKTFLGFAEVTDGEEMVTQVTDADAKNAIKAELLISRAIVDKAALEKKNGAPETEAELREKYAEQEMKKVTGKDISQRKEQMAAEKKEGVAKSIAQDKKAYNTNVSEISQDVEVGLHVLAVADADIKECNKANPNSPVIPDLASYDANETIQKAIQQTEASIILDYHHHARLHDQRYAHAQIGDRSGQMSRYGEYVDVSRTAVSDGHTKVLKGLDENKDKFDAEGKKKEGQHLTVNGIPCEKVGVVNLYKLNTGFSFMGRAWRTGNRIEQLGKFTEAFMVETTAANQEAYQALNPGGILTTEKMMEAYATGDTLPDGRPNKNKRPNGPINALVISNFNLDGGLESTLLAFAELQAMYDILGIAINIDTDSIAKNAPPEDRGLASCIQLEWKRHSAPHDERYGKPARKAVEEKYHLEHITDPMEKRAALRKALAGNDATTETAVFTATAQTSQGAGTIAADPSAAAAGMGPAVTGAGTGAPPAAPVVPATVPTIPSVGTVALTTGAKTI